MSHGREFYDGPIVRRIPSQSIISMKEENGLTQIRH